MFFEGKVPLQKFRRRIIPGFGISLGITLFYLTLILFLPLSALVLSAAGIGWNGFVEAAASPAAMASYGLTIWTSLVGAAVNTAFGLLIAWVLVRYKFPGRRLMDAAVDIPFALPGPVAGLALSAVFAKSGWIGSLFAEQGIRFIYNEIGIILAIVFTGIPFVVRSVQPVIEGLDRGQEEAARLLGASRIRIFWRVIFPTVLPALLNGFTLSFARGIGEYGTLIFVTSNIPFKTEVTTRLIYTKIESYEIAGATAIAAVTLLASLVLLFALNMLQLWQRRNARRS